MEPETWIVGVGSLSSVLRTLLRFVVVKTELSLKLKLSIDWFMFQPSRGVGSDLKDEILDTSGQ